MIAEQDLDKGSRRALVALFWRSARGFWSDPKSRAVAWWMTIGLLVIVLVQLFVQYRLNIWNRELFDAIEKKNAQGVLTQAMIFVPLAIAGVGLAMLAVYGRMRAQRRWRAWLNDYLIDRWLNNGRYYQLNLIPGDHENPEHRIAEDARIATDSPVDFAVGILGAILTVITFIGVLWGVGGSITFELGGADITIPGYLVIAVVAYAAITSVAMVVIAGSFVRVAEDKNQAEAEYRYAITRLRENGESIALLGGEEEERAGLRTLLRKVITRWAKVGGQHLRTTLVSNTNYLIAPVIPVILCAPKYLDGSMSLGQVTQAAAAFVQVQTAFNWLVDNYPRLADWRASARRVASLIFALDKLDNIEKSGIGMIERKEHTGAAIRLHGLSVTLSDGTVVVDDTDANINLGEKVLVVGESGTGKSTLVRAIAGLWPWGEGEVNIKTGARLFLMPQKAYVPLGTLRRAATYPAPVEDFGDETVKAAMEKVGLGHLNDRLDEEEPWDKVLSGGEQQRLAFARLLLHKPDIVVMDEATSALDPPSQEKLMYELYKDAPETAVISVGHRPELEAFHERKLTLERRKEGAQLVKDQVLPPSTGIVGLLMARWRRPGAPPRPVSDDVASVPEPERERPFARFRRHLRLRRVNSPADRG